MRLYFLSIVNSAKSAEKAILSQNCQLLMIQLYPKTDTYSCFSSNRQLMR